MKNPGALKDLLYQAVTHVYPPDSYNASTNRFNFESEENYFNSNTDLDQRKEAYEYHIKRYSQSKITIATSFLGLPNYCEFGHEQTWENIARNFLGLQNNKTPGRNIINIIKLPLVILKNIVLVLLTFPLSVAKLVTELLPLVCAELLRYTKYHVHQYAQSKPRDSLEYFLLNAAYIILFAFNLAALGVHFIGRSITSPVKGLLDAFHEGKHLNGFNRGGNFMGTLFAASSLCFSIAFYAFLFPLIFTAASSAISLDFTIKVMNIFSNLPQLSTAGTVLMGPGLYSALTALGFSTPALNALAAVGGMIGAAITVIGTPLQYLVDKFNHFWNTENHDNTKPALSSKDRLDISSLSNVQLPEIASSTLTVSTELRKNNLNNSRVDLSHSSDSDEENVNLDTDTISYDESELELENDPPEEPRTSFIKST